jgi:membrane fusion protein (multidrug efflux system)
MARANVKNTDEHKTTLKRRMRWMLLILGSLFAAIFIYKGIMGLVLKHFMSTASKVVTVSSTKVAYATWNTELKAVGSVRAVRGVSITTELAGLVKTIYFTPGATVNAGDRIVDLNTSSDVALLHSLQATAELDKITYNRDVAQLAIKGVSKAVVDTDAANLKSALAQVEQQQATIAKKIIVAPFKGRLGISMVNPGQYLNVGDSVVTLQQLDPIYVDFYVPQQELARLALNQTVAIRIDTFPNEKFTGKITTINPLVDSATRNVEVEATVDNPAARLAPGMFVTVNVDTGAPERYLTLPQTAISFNPYGDIVYIIKKDKKDKHGKVILTVEQSFVKEGRTRGEQVAIIKGVSEGDEVVTSGQLKLKNGYQVTIDNSVVPSDNPAPTLPNDH